MVLSICVCVSMGFVITVILNFSCNYDRKTLITIVIMVIEIKYIILNYERNYNCNYDQNYNSHYSRKAPQELLYKSHHALSDLYPLYPFVCYDRPLLFSCNNKYS